MSRTALFWGIAFILLGVVLFFQAAGYISGSVWGYLWAVLLIFSGIWVISGRYYKPKFDDAHSLVVSRKDAKQADVAFEFGAASLVVTGGASANNVLEGLSGAGLDLNTDYIDDTVNIRVNAGPSFIPFVGPDGGAWHFRLNNDMPMSLKLDSGASSVDLDLTQLKITDVLIETGASSTKIILPAKGGKTRLNIDGGAASFDIYVPEGVAARVRISQGASSIRVDENRFPRNSSGVYLSPDFDTAENAADITFNSGAASLKIQ